jgi:hypothetical protein
MAIEYTYTMKDISGDTISVEIHHDDHVGAAIPLPLGTDMPIGIYVPQKDITEQIWGLGCKINIKTSEGLSQYDHLFATAERERYVKITKGTITIFEGFILPNVYEQEMMPVKTITIPANNQLSNLRDYRSELLDTDSAFSTIFLFDLIKDILDNGTGLELPIYVKNTLFSTLYASAFNIDTTCYDKLKINKQIYVDEDEVMDGFSILQDILKVTYSRLYYFNGKWIIDRIRDMRLTNDYKIYPFDYPTTAASSGTLTHEDFSLEDEYKIANSGHLEYSAGMQKHNVIIDFDKYDNLVEPMFRDVIQVSWANFADLQLGVWQLLEGAVIDDESYVSTNVTNGIKYNQGTITTGNWPGSPLCTSFFIDNQDDFSIRIKFTYDNLKNVLGAEWKDRIRLRYKVGSAWRCLIKDGDGDIVPTSSLYLVNNGPYIENISTITDISIESRKVDVDETIEINNIKSVLDTDLDTPDAVQVYLDILPIQRDDVAQAEQYVGDVLVEQNNPVQNNMITGTLNTIFNRVMETRLRIYDSDYVNYKNTLLLEHDDVIYKSRDWSDDHIDHVEKLHYVFIHDTAQQHNTARHSIKVDLWLRDDQGVVVSLGSIFSYDTQLSGKKFMVMGYDFNVKMCTYRIYLRELKEYDNFVLKAGAVPPGTDWPNDMVISYLALNPEQAAWMTPAIRAELLSRLGTGKVPAYYFWAGWAEQSSL